MRLPAAPTPLKAASRRGLDVRPALLFSALGCRRRLQPVPLLQVLNMDSALTDNATGFLACWRC